MPEKLKKKENKNKIRSGRKENGYHKTYSS